MIQDGPTATVVVPLAFHNLKAQLQYITSVSLFRFTIETIVQKRDKEVNESPTIIVALRVLKCLSLVAHLGILTLLIVKILCQKYDIEPQRLYCGIYWNAIYQSVEDRICVIVHSCRNYYRAPRPDVVDVQSSESLVVETDEEKDKELKLSTASSFPSDTEMNETMSNTPSTMKSASHFNICGFYCRRRRYVDANAAIPTVVEEGTQQSHAESLSWNLRVKDS